MLPDQLCKFKNNQQSYQQIFKTSNMRFIGIFYAGQRVKGHMNKDKNKLIKRHCLWQKILFMSWKRNVVACIWFQPIRKFINRNKADFCSNSGRRSLCYKKETYLPILSGSAWILNIVLSSIKKLTLDQTYVVRHWLNLDKGQPGSSFTVRLAQH